jgi:hypothetical protein
LSAEDAVESAAGMAHLTVVPANFDPDDETDELAVAEPVRKRRREDRQRDDEHDEREQSREGVHAEIGGEAFAHGDTIAVRLYTTTGPGASLGARRHRFRPPPDDTFVRRRVVARIATTIYPRPHGRV